MTDQELLDLLDRNIQAATPIMPGTQRAHDQAARAIAGAFPGLEPEAAAKNVRDAQALGLPAEAARVNPETVRRDLKIKQVDDYFSKNPPGSAPATEALAADPNLGPAIHDDLDNLSTFEKFLGKFSKTTDEGTGETTFHWDSPQWSKKYVERPFKQGMESNWEHDLAYRRMQGALSPEDEQKFQGILGKKPGADEETPWYTHPLTSLVGATPYMAEAWGRGAKLGVEAGTVAAGVGALGGGIGALPAAGAGYAAGQAIGNYQRMAELEQGGVYLAMLRAGVDPTTAKEAAQAAGPVKALLMGGIFGLAKEGVAKAAEKLGLQKVEQTAAEALTKSAQKPLQAATRAAAQWGKAAAEGGALGATLAATDVTTKGLATGHPETILTQESAKEVGLAALEFAGMVGLSHLPATVIGGGLDVTNAYRYQEHAQRTHDFLDELKGATEGTKTRERLPEALQKIAAEATKDGPVEHLIMPAEAVERLYQERNENPVREALKQIVPDYEEQEARALRDGADLKISTADASAKIVGTPLWDHIAPDLKTDPHPDVPTPRQHAERMALLQGELETKAKEAQAELDRIDTEQAAQEGKPNPLDTKALHERVTTALMEAGDFPKKHAEQMATILTARFATRAEDNPELGLSASDYAALHGIEIRRGEEGSDIGKVYGTEPAAPVREVLVPDVGTPEERYAKAQEAAQTIREGDIIHQGEGIDPWKVDRILKDGSAVLVDPKDPSVMRITDNLAGELIPMESVAPDGTQVREPVEVERAGNSIQPVSIESAHALAHVEPEVARQIADVAPEIEKLPEGAQGGLVKDEATGQLVFNIEDAAKAIAAGKDTLYQGVESPVEGRYYRGRPGEAKPTGAPLAHEVVTKALSEIGVKLFDFDQSGTVEEAAQFAAEVKWLTPEVKPKLERQKLRWNTPNKLGFYGNEKMAFGNDAYRQGRNTYDIAGCGREAWARVNGLDLAQACYGGACYAEPLKKAKQGLDAGVTKGVNKLAVTGQNRRDALLYFQKHGMDAARKAYPEYEFAIVKPDAKTRTKLEEQAASGGEAASNFLKDEDGKWLKATLGYYKNAKGEFIPFHALQSHEPLAAVVSTNLANAKGQDIRLGVDTDGAAWLSRPEVMDALLEANPNSLSVYSSAYHTPPPPHELAGRTIINVTISGWHPLPETLARLRWAEEARGNGWNVILREVTADPNSFALDTVEVYNRLHDALMKTDFFLMQQPLHIGEAHGEALYGIPGCCVGSAKNEHTCDACETAEGLGKRFQEYWKIAEEDRREEQILPDVKSYSGRQPTDIRPIEMGQYFRGQTFNQDPLTLYHSAFHGSPYKFDKFSLEHMGKGEGAQAYGWGLYFAGNKEIAEYYRATLSNDFSAKMNVIKEAIPGGVPDAIASRIVSNLMYNDLIPASAVRATGYANSEYRGFVDEHEAELIKAAEAAKEAKAEGRTYKVDLAPSEDEYLLWDKPMSEQSEKVKAAAGKLALPKGYESSMEIILRNETGRDLYDFVRDVLGGQEAASKALLDAGIPGIKYLDGTSRSAGEGSHNYVIFNDADVNIEEYWARKEGEPSGPQGSITFELDRTIIRIFKSRDLSTALHEFGHLFLRDLADEAKGNTRAQADLETALRWVGADSLDSMTREQHEKWARTWEEYLMEGKAPSKELEGVFARIKQWMIRIYQKFSGVPGSEISPEMRGVFDRLLATDEQIDAYRRSQEGRPIFKDAEAAGMTEAEFKAYQEATVGGVHEALNNLRTKMMESVRRGKAKWWREERNKVLEEKRAEVEADPVYSAMDMIRKREAPEAAGGKEAGALNKQALLDIIGEEGIKALPRTVPPLWSESGTLDPSLVGEAFGFKDGEEFLSALLGARTKSDEINARADEEMTRRHGDPLNDGSIADEVATATHGADARLEALTMELKALLRKAKRGYAPTVEEQLAEARGQDAADEQATKDWWRAEQEGEKAVNRRNREALSEGRKSIKITKEELDATRERVAQEVSQRPLVKLRPNDHLQKEAQFAREAEKALLKDDYAAAAEAKRKQILNHLLAGETKKALSDAEAVRKKLLRYEDANAAPKSIPLEYREQAAAIIEDLGLKRMSGAQVEKAAARRNVALELHSWLADLEARGEPIPEVDPALLSMPPGRHYTELSIAELRGYQDTVDSILHVGRDDGKLIARDQKEDLEMVVGELADRAAQQPQRKKTEEISEKPDKAAAALAYLRVPENFFRTQMDGTKTLGPWFRAFTLRLADAADRKDELTKMLAEALDTAAKETLGEKGLEALTSKEWSEKRAYEELGGARLSKLQVLVLALNMGNAGNIDRLEKGFGHGAWTSGLIKEVIDKTLSKDEARFVGRVWQTLELTQPDAEEVAIKATGIRPQWVEAVPIRLAGVDLPGGYYPIAYNPEASNLWADIGAAFKADKLDLKKTLQEAMGGRAMSAATRTGHLKERTGGGGRQVSLEISHLMQHLDEVSHDIAYRLAIRDVNKLLREPEVLEAIEGVGGKEMVREIQTWVGHVATDYRTKHRIGLIEKILLKARAGQVFYAMGYNLQIALDAMADVAKFAIPGGVGPADTWHGIVTSLAGMDNQSRAQVIEAAKAKSGVLRRYSEEFDRDLYETAKRSLSGKQGGNVFTRSAYVPVKFFEQLVATAGWLGAYQKELKASGIESRAIEYADSELRRVMGTGRVQDLSPLMRPDSPASKLWTTFNGWFNRNWNVFQDTVEWARRKEVSKPELAAAFFFGYVMPAILPEMLRGRYRQSDEDKQKESWTAFALKKGIMDLALFGPEHIPIFGSGLKQAVQNYERTKNIHLSIPALGPIESTLKTIGNVIHVGVATAKHEPDPLRHMDWREASKTLAWTGVVPGNAGWRTLDGFTYWLANDQKAAPGHVVSPLLGPPPGTKRKR